MSMLPELKGKLHMFFGKARRLEPNDHLAAPETKNSEGPHTEKEIPWDKFKRYFSPLPGSLASIRQDQIDFGDIYLAPRKSGSELTIVPIHIQGWRRKKSSADLLLILGFNQQDRVVGMRTVTLDLSTEVLSAEGALASAVCSDGIGSAIEQVRARTSSELLMGYIDQGYRFDHLSHHVVDENREVLEILRIKATQRVSDELMKKRYEHAASDRPRWESLFSKPSMDESQKGGLITIVPDHTVDRGFRSLERTVFEMVRTPTNTRAEWAFNDRGNNAYAEIADRGLLSKSYIQEKMAEALQTPPES